jgi:hypothetical protein
MNFYRSKSFYLRPFYVTKFNIFLLGASALLYIKYLTSPTGKLCTWKLFTLETLYVNTVDNNTTNQQEGKEPIKPEYHVLAAANLKIHKDVPY